MGRTVEPGPTAYFIIIRVALYLVQRFFSKHFTLYELTKIISHTNDIVIIIEVHYKEKYINFTMVWMSWNSREKLKIDSRMLVYSTKP